MLQELYIFSHLYFRLFNFYFAFLFRSVFKFFSVPASINYFVLSPSLYDIDRLVLMKPIDLHILCKVSCCKKKIDNSRAFFFLLSFCSAWLRLKLNTKIGSHTHHPPHKLLVVRHCPTS